VFEFNWKNTVTPEVKAQEPQVSGCCGWSFRWSLKEKKVIATVPECLLWRKPICSGVDSANFLGQKSVGGKMFGLRRITASQSTKWLYVLKIFGVWPPGYAYPHMAGKSDRKALVMRERSNWIWQNLAQVWKRERNVPNWGYHAFWEAPTSYPAFQNLFAVHCLELL